MKDRKPVCRAAALGMAGAVLVLHAGAASACMRTGGTAFAEGQQDSPAPDLSARAGITLAARAGEKKASDGPEQDSVLERWDINPDHLPPEENDQVPSVPEEIRQYFEEAVAGTVEKYAGDTPPASDLSRYSLRSDTIRAEVRAKAHSLMKKESGQILDRMNSFALSFGGPAIAQMASDMQSRTVGKMAAFGKGQEDEEKNPTSHRTDNSSSSSHSSEGSPSSWKSPDSGSPARVPFLSIIPSSKEQPSDPETGQNDSSRDNGTENPARPPLPAEDGKKGWAEEDKEGWAEEDNESSLEENRDSSVADGKEYTGEAYVSPDSEHIRDNYLPGPPPGMSSFLSYLPVGSLLTDEDILSSHQDPTESSNYEETSSEGFSSGEASSEGFSSGEASSEGLSSGEASSQGFSSDEASSEGISSEKEAADAGSADSFSGIFSDADESDLADNEIFPDLTANFALARPFTSGRLYYKYAGKISRSSGSESEENDDTDYARDDLSAETSSSPSAAHRNVVYIGDSRTVGMEMFVGGREDEYWCAKNSMGYSWMVNTATPSVDSMIGENTDVVILMGVNDLGNAGLYVDYMNEKAAEWKTRGARTFFVSVTPVVDSKSPNAKNSRIESFNAYAIENLRNVHYIDAYNRIRYSFGSPDGIHFDAATYREIYRIIHFYLYQGWYEEAGLRFYFDCGQPVTGWHFLDGSWQYMDGAGVRWVSNSRVGDVCLAPYPLTGLTDPDIRFLSSTGSDTQGEK